MPMPKQRLSAVAITAAVLLPLLALSVATRAEPQQPAPEKPAEAAADAVAPAAPKTMSRDELLISSAYKYFPGEEGRTPPKRLFRLTREQIDQTVAALLPGLAPRPVKEAVSKDPLQTNYEYADLLAINASNVGALTGWIADVAAAARKSPERIVDCAPSKLAEPCLDKAARGFALKAFRGDVAPDKLDRIARFYIEGVKGAGFAEATGELVEIVLSSPDFLFRKEVDVDRNRRLAPAQLLQALTYTLADTPPQVLGFDVENPAQHLNGKTAHATIDRIVASKAAREKLVRFFLTWLEVKDAQSFTISAEVFPEFTPKLAQAMIDETTRFLAHALSQPTPKLADITEARQSFVSTEMAQIYKTAAADPTGRKLASLDASQRFGVLSHPSVIASHSGPTGTRPIKRGVFWVRKVMCMEMEPPANGLDSTLDETLHTTERKRIEHATRRKACVGCHKLIDPLGFFQESYDALGRWRTEDNGFPIDTNVSFSFLDEGPATAATPVDALKTFTQSVMFKQCFVRQMFRYYMGRNEEPGDDPLLRRAFLALAHDDDILEMVRIIAASERIAQRS